MTSLHQPARSSSTPAVIVDNLHKRFGDFQALRGISFTVERGEVLGLLGPNGAGKTTTVDIMCTLARPDEGTVRVAGHDVVTDAAAVRRSIMLTGQHVALDTLLTGRENLIMFARLQGLRKAAAKRRADELLEQFDLVYAEGRQVGTYSGGMRRRIDIACGMVVRPEVVFLDEPTTGLDPRSRQSVWDLVSTFKAEGIATVLTTQYLEEVDTLSDHIVVLNRGSVIAAGTADELKERTGGSFCEIVPRHAADLPALISALAPLLPRHAGSPLTDDGTRLSLPAPLGADSMALILDHVRASGIPLSDLALRRPSLDEVFFALTGAAADAPDSGTATPGPSTSSVDRRS